MSIGKAKIGEDGRLEIQPTKHLAILWSFNPVTAWKAPHQLVGSVHAHVGHLALYGAVYWDLIFKVSEEVLSHYDYPMSGYLYNSSTQLVQYRVRVVDMSPGPTETFNEYVPIWRTAGKKGGHLYILIDQIEELVPHRPITDFVFFDDSRPLKSPPSGNYFKVRDPLY